MSSVVIAKQDQAKELDGAPGEKTGFLRACGPTAQGNRDHIAAELDRKRFRHDRHPSS